MRRAASSYCVIGAAAVVPKESLRHKGNYNRYADLLEKPLDKQVGQGGRKGPPTAHALPVYKTAHKLQNNARWKTANVTTQIAQGQHYSLRETYGEGKMDDTGMYRDWLHGEERRFANYLAIGLGVTSFTLFWYTMKTMGNEVWDIPTPTMKQPAVAGRPSVAIDKAAPLTPPLAPGYKQQGSGTVPA
jgi:hypothetical protein